MPRLHGYAETYKLNVYDAVQINAEHRHRWFGGRARMFGVEHVGNGMLTNLLSPGQLGGYDQTAYIQNWYARTNVPPCLALDNFMHVAYAELVVGYKPEMKLPLFDLLRRPQDEPLPVSVETPEKGEEIVTAMAERMFEAFIMEVDPHSRRALSDELPHVVRGWRAAAATARRMDGGKPIILVPPRQDIYVELACPPDELEALRLAASHFVIEPQPLIWIHLQGFSRRDVC